MNRKAILMAAAITAATISTPAAAQDCVRVVGFDWSPNIILDPARMLTGAASMHAYAIYDQLIRIDKDFGVHPQLAESWEVTEGGKVWTFKLRNDVRFHDGSALDAEDVVFTYRRLIDPDVASPAASVLSGLTADNIEALDSHTVRFTLETPNADFAYILAEKYAQILPSGITDEQLGTAPNGTGPFMIESFEAGSPRTILVRNPEYWDAGKPKSECIELRGISEPVTRATVVMSGEADLAVAADATTLQLLQSNEDIVLTEAPGATIMTLSMMIDEPPFDDERVRDALKLVIDRQAIVDNALLGFGIPGADSPIAITWPDSHTDTAPGQDIARARELLAEAGYADGLDIELYTGATDLYPGTLVMAQMFQQMAAEAGVNVEIVTAPADGFWESAWMKVPFVTSYWFARPPATAFPLGYRSDAAFNETHWYRDDFDAMLDEASATVDPEARREIYQRAGAYLADEGGVIVPMIASTVAAVNVACQGYEPHVDLNRVDLRDVSCDR